MYDVLKGSGIHRIPEENKMSKKVKILGKSIGLIPLIAFALIGIMSTGAILYTLYQTSVNGVAVITVKGLEVQSIQAKDVIVPSGTATEPYKLGTVATTLKTQMTGGTTPVVFREKAMFLVLKQNTLNGDIVKMAVSAYDSTGTTPLPAGSWDVAVQYVDFAKGSFGANVYTEVLAQGSELSDVDNVFTLSNTDYSKWGYDPAQADTTTHGDGNAICLSFTFQPQYKVVGGLPNLNPLDAVIKIDISTGTA